MNRKFDILVLAAIVLVLGLAASQPSHRLQENAPAEFMYNGPQVSARQRAAEQRIARAYWKCAVKGIQWQYGYAHRLPSLPPPAFAISKEEFGAAADDAALRSYYWNKLQSVWYMDSVWRNQYDWSFRSFGKVFDGAGNWLHEQAKGFVGD